MKGILLDCRSQGNHITLWIKTGEGTEKCYIKHTAKIYLQAEDNKKAIDLLASKGYACSPVIVRDLLTDELQEAVAVYSPDLENMHSFVREIEKLGEYNFRLYNADLDAEQMFLFEHGLAPLCSLECEIVDGLVYSIKRLADVDEIKLKTSRVEVSTEYDPLINYGCKAARITLDEHAIVGAEKDILQRFAQLYEQKDPDVVLIVNGDKYAVEYLLYRFHVNKIPFSFSRELQGFVNMAGKSYFSYGRIVRREPAHYFLGRYHIDASGFMYNEGELEGIFHLARLGCMPVQKVARLSPGAVITNLYIYTAYQKGYPIPYKVNMVEDFKTARTLFYADKGGFIYEPLVGFHTEVAEIDFVSLYPHIMVNYNISPETILCECCAGKNKVPYSGYHICEKRRGLVPEVLEPLIKHRIELKKRYKETGDEKYKAMASALKWVLVTSFGYTGYRRSRFGRIEAHESITSYARHILIGSTKIAEDMGFVVLHGIVDSLWIKKKGITEEEVKKLVERIQREYNIPLSVEGIYRWIVFSPSVNDSIAPVPNRYYGVFRNGEVKVRGIEIRRRDAPAIVKQFQEEAIDALSQSASKKEFMKNISACLRILREYKKNLKNKEIVWDDLVIRKSVTREKEGYKGAAVQKVVMEKLEKYGLKKQPGEAVEYVITNAQAEKPEHRYTPKQIQADYDSDKYYELLVRALENLLITFGYDEERIRNEATGTVQTKLLYWRVLDY